MSCVELNKCGETRIRHSRMLTATFSFRRLISQTRCLCQRRPRRFASDRAHCVDHWISGMIVSRSS
jgi:hypothetical protein